MTVLLNPFGTFGGGGGGGSFDPSQLSTLFDWYDPVDAATITSSAGRSSQWNSKKSGGHNLVQATGALQPYTGSRTLNGKNVMDWQGGQAMATSFTLMSQPFTLFVVGQCDVASGSGNSNFYMDGIDATNRAIFYDAPQTPARIVSAPTIQNSSGGYDTNAHVYCVVYNGASSKLYVGGGSNLISASPGTNGLAGYTIGARYNQTQFNLDGLTGDIIVCTGDISATEKNNAGNFLATKWALSWSNVSA